jgi:glycine cleavage system H protein
MVPKELKYTKEHEWIKIEGDNVTVGITEHAQSELGDIVFVEMPAAEQEITKAGEFGVVESVKTVSNLYAPVSGKVVEINKVLNDQPETVNKDPYGTGWIMKVALTDKSELDSLLSAEDYEKVIS